MRVILATRSRSAIPTSTHSNMTPASLSFRPLRRQRRLPATPVTAPWHAFRLAPAGESSSATSHEAPPSASSSRSSVAPADSWAAGSTTRPSSLVRAIRPPRWNSAALHPQGRTSRPFLGTHGPLASSTILGPPYFRKSGWQDHAIPDAAE